MLLRLASKEVIRDCEIKKGLKLADHGEKLSTQLIQASPKIIRRGKGGIRSGPADVLDVESDCQAVRDSFQAIFTLWAFVAKWKSGGDLPKVVPEALSNRQS